ncbi:MAG: hypothetical protein GTO02_22300 [Candidatus Dadabacteria bacterium]|nr:hypothetical protein [Candidatus Dadabacteria bacterium]
MNESKIRKVKNLKLRIWENGTLKNSMWKNKNEPLFLILVTSHDTFNQMLLWEIWKGSGDFIKTLYPKDSEKDFEKLADLMKTEQVIAVESTLEHALNDMDFIVPENNDEYHITYTEIEQEKPIKVKKEKPIHESQWVRARDYA